MDIKWIENTIKFLKNIEKNKFSWILTEDAKKM